MNARKKRTRLAQGGKLRDQNTLRQFLKKRAVGSTRDSKTKPVIGSYMYFFHCLGDQSECLKEMLRLIKKANRAKLKAISDLAARNRLSADINDVMKEIDLENAALAQEEMQDILAGTIFVILNSLLRSMSSRVKKRGGKDGPEIAGRRVKRTSLYELIRAASNNFRHFEEWNKNVLKNKNIAVLKKAGLRGPWDRNLCMEVFSTIDWKSHQQLDHEVRKLASEIFQYQTGIQL